MCVYTIFNICQKAYICFEHIFFWLRQYDYFFYLFEQGFGDGFFGNDKAAETVAGDDW